jgi:polyphenol oxidase
MTVDTPEEFHGGKFCTAGKKFTGSLENGGHTAAHIWVGMDMGNLRTAARDPVFYCNHSNVDRMWHLWTTRLGRNDLPYQEWLDTSFVFYDETKRPVRIRVQDVLDIGKLGYTFEKKKRLEWLEKRPKPSTGIKRPFIAKRSVTPASSFPLALKKGKNEYVTVERPEKAQAGGGSSRKAPEVLVLDLTVDPCEYAKFDVLVNVPRGQEKKVGPKNSEYAGSFTHVPHGNGDGGRMMDTQKVSYRLNLREIIEDLKCGRDKRLDITIVPVAGEKTIVNSVGIDIL